EAIKGAIAKVPQQEVALSIIHDAVGDITESDLTLAAASNAVVIGFNTKMEAPARRVAEATKVDVRQYKVIYELLDDVQKALTGMLEPEMVESLLGHAEVRQGVTSGHRTNAGSGRGEPRTAFPTVTAVALTPDLRSAKVHVSVLGDEEASAATMKALEDAKPFLRRELCPRTDLRFVPELTFVHDRSAEQAVRISAL